MFVFSRDEQYKVVRELLSDYAAAHKRQEQTAQTQENHEQALDDFAIKQTSIFAFRALFAQHPEFETDLTAEEFLSSPIRGDAEGNTGTLCDWVDELMSSHLGVETYLSFDASTVEMLMSRLMPYMTTAEQRGGQRTLSLWPLVRHIRFGLGVSLLKHNITLFDLPDLSRANETSAQNVTRHLRLCTHHIVVAEIGRAADEKFIRGVLKNAHATQGDGRTILVLTHADTIDDDTDVKGTTQDFQDLDALRSEMKALEQKRTEVTSQMKHASGGEKYELMDQRDQLARDMRQRSAQHHTHRIRMRSHEVSCRVQELYAKLTGDAITLPVFCVGNTAYRKHRSGYAVDDPNSPTLTVEATNIPALRRHLLAPVQAKLNEKRHLVATQLPTLLLCFNMYVSKTGQDRKNLVGATIKAARTMVPGLIHKVFLDFHQKIEEGLLSKLRREVHDWSVDAQGLVQDWAKNYSCQNHFAFLRRYGHSLGSKKDGSDISWTGELIALRSEELRHCFDDFARSFTLPPTDVASRLDKLVCIMMKNIVDRTKAKPMAIQPYLKSIEQEQSNMTTFVEKSVNAMRRDLAILSKNAASDHPYNHIAIAMRPVYERASNIKGQAGTPRDRLEFFEAEVTKHDTGVLMKANDVLKKQLDALVQKHETALLKSSISFFKGLEDDFHVMCTTQGLDDPEDVELRDKLQELFFELATEKLAPE